MDHPQDRIAVTVNGESHDVDADLHVSGLLEHLGVKATACAVEVNREIVPRSAHADRHLRPGDAIEIVSFVGGG